MADPRRSTPDGGSASQSGLSLLDRVVSLLQRRVQRRQIEPDEHLARLLPLLVPYLVRIGGVFPRIMLAGLVTELDGIAERNN